MRIYLDNAATTAIDKEVWEAMSPYFLEFVGNPSSIHSHGREARSAIEKSRKKIAELLNTSPSEIFFTSGGTEADNMAICSSVETMGIKHAISSKAEHHAVLHTLEALEKKGAIELSFVHLDEKGNLDMNHLEQLLSKNPKSLVSLMHANNEIGNIYNIDAIGNLCREHSAVFHSDTVQTMGHYTHDLSTDIHDFVVGAAHKFHGPKGAGFLYINHRNKINPLIHGGSQERNMRGGTENVAGIVGLAKALEIAYRDMNADRKHIEKLKLRMIASLNEKIHGVSFNGESENMDKSLYTVLNVGLPESDDNDMLLFSLDIKKISVSGGSACTSGTNIGSHVLTAIGANPKKGAIRFSFSKFTTTEEIDYAVDSLSEIVNK
ncbi:cysteine desulfurase family protein [Reichenbachiella sp. MALMAid0571]|uniref:cysteine desulfurase family protein n=1 Tax=Reichenbachiella sp. MALMAid0571 TaxID=3143939 RepID=UPI0032DF6C8B